MRFLNSKAGRRLTVGIAALALGVCYLILAESELPPGLRLGLALDFSDRLSLCGFILGAVVALAAVPQLLSIAETSRSAHYSQLDTLYFDLLKMAVDKPYLRRPGNLTPVQCEEYESYAFMVWNFLETLRDRCEDDQALKDIWAPVIAIEHDLHSAWFYGETTPYWEKEAPKFRLPFADFIWSRFGSSTSPVCGNVLHEQSSAWIGQSWKLRNVNEISADPEVRAYLGEPKEHAARAADAGTSERDTHVERTG